MSSGNSNGQPTQTFPIVFNSCKNEIFQVTDNYKTIHRKLKANWKVEV